MQKTKITLEVPERIAVLVQNYVQRELVGYRDYNFSAYLSSNDISRPMLYIQEISIGIEHPDDTVKIQDFWLKEHRDVNRWLFNRKCYSYMDMILEEHLYSISCLDEINVDPPQTVLDFIQSVKATDCSYFRFVNS